MHLAVLLASAAPALAARPTAATLDETGRVLVRLRGDEAERSRALAELAALRCAGAGEAFRARHAEYQRQLEAARASLVELVETQGARVASRLWLIDALVLEGATPGLEARLAAHPGVLAVERGVWREPQLEQAIDAAHHDFVGAHALTTSGLPGGAVVEGQGVTIAIIDSGLDGNMGASGRPHAAFFVDGDPANQGGGGIGGSRILALQDFAFFDSSSSPEDVFGHGTRVGSIAAGAEWSALADVADGGAPAALVKGFKISVDGTPGLASTITMAEAFDAAAADPDVRVANMSYDGDSNPSAFLNQAIDNAVLAGVFVTLSGGNAGADLSFAHGCYNALVAGASEEALIQPANLPGFVESAVGPLPGGRRYPHLLGQGASVTCAQIDTEAATDVSFGTSAAAGLLAGAGALVIQARANATPLEVRAMLVNSARSVTLGNPHAAGWGYLDARDAVAEAIAGRVVSEVIAVGETLTFNRSLAAGEAASFTLVWNRESGTALSIDDLDLRVRDPLGSVIAWSASQVDDVEQIRFTAALDGVYKVQVLGIGFHGDNSAAFALAGVDSPSLGSGCTGGLPLVESHSPPLVPTLGEYGSLVVLNGCGFSGVLAVNVAGIAAAFTVVDDQTLILYPPPLPAIGSVPLTLSELGGSSQAMLATVAPAPTVWIQSPIAFNGSTLDLRVGSVPGDFYVLAGSTDLVPSVVPGVYAVDIGNGGATLFPLALGVVGPAGWSGAPLGPLAGIPFGTFLYFQAAVLPAAAPVLPLASTNVQQVLVQ